jgi:hypothetical protein
MFKICLSVLFLTFCGSAPLSTFAQTSVINSGETVPNAPYSAERRFTSIDKSADGTINRSQSGGSEARDSQGLTYSAGERHWTYKEDGKSVLKSEILYRLHDPVANTDTQWDTTSKEVKVIHWPKALAKQDPANTSCPVCPEGSMSGPGDGIEKLGLKTIEGVAAEGTRSSYTVPATKGHSDSPIVVTHESWYCPELKIIILETNDDPRSGETRNKLVHIVRGKPEVSKYNPPADYVVHHVQIPSDAAQ